VRLLLDRAGDRLGELGQLALVEPRLVGAAEHEERELRPADLARHEDLLAFEPRADLAHQLGERTEAAGPGGGAVGVLDRREGRGVHQHHAAAAEPGESLRERGQALPEPGSLDRGAESGGAASRIGHDPCIGRPRAAIERAGRGRARPPGR
jgi:hypothetical protein